MRSGQSCRASSLMTTFRAPADINFRDQLHPGGFEHKVHRVIEHKQGLSVFYPRFRSDATGLLIYGQTIVLENLLYVYSHCCGYFINLGKQEGL